MRGNKEERKKSPSIVLLILVEEGTSVRITEYDLQVVHAQMEPEDIKYTISSGQSGLSKNGILTERTTKHLLTKPWNICITKCDLIPVCCQHIGQGVKKITHFPRVEVHC